MDVQLLFPSPPFTQKRKYEGLSEGPSKSYKFRDAQSAVDFTSFNFNQERFHGSSDVPSHPLAIDDLDAFEVLPMKSQLGVLTASLEYADNFEKALPLFSTFNRIHLPLKSEMKDSEDCGHLPLISEVISHLELLQRMPVLDNQKQEFQTLAFSLLGLLARNASASELINQLGAIPLTTTQIKLSVHHAQLFRSCCFALANFTNSIPKELYDAFNNYINEERLIHLLCNSLRDNASDSRIISDVCVLLGNIIFFSNALENQIGNDQIAFILQLLCLHINEQELVGHLTFLLRNLCDGEWRNMIEQNKGSEIALFVLNKYMWVPELCLDLVAIIFDLQKANCAKPLSIETLRLLFRATRTTFLSSATKQKLLLQSIFSYFVLKDDTKKIEMVEAGLIETIKDMKLPNTFYLYHFFEAIARLPEMVYAVPQESVPSLQELSLRSIKNKLHQQKEEADCFAFLIDDEENLQGDYEAKKNAFLCDEMKECLDTKSKGNCHVCKTFVFDHFFKFLKKERLDGVHHVLPVPHIACSKHCLQKIHF